ncbi:hypothetical protein A4X13_0g393 [Tilletia indica]|uniref:Autophagy-related protein n=1 Tax=Tilletia indica TaxID=43049 RepID=A0A177TSB8_9BASI|nr:hypothetical protein A4X13_0g393 [Tilletia indica]
MAVAEKESTTTPAVSHYSPPPAQQQQAEDTKLAHQDQQVVVPKSVDAEDVDEEEDVYAAALLSSSADPAAYQDKYITTRTELWAYYVYYIGNQGLGPFNFGPSQLQNLLTLAAEAAGNGTCGGSDQVPCRLPWAGSDRTVESLVLLANGIGFAIQVVLFLFIGSLADYGSYRPWILVFFTVCGAASCMAWFGVTDPSQWQAAMGIYIINNITYQGALSFYSAAFPGLVRGLPEVRESAEKLSAKPPQTTAEDHAKLESLQRNRVVNISFGVQAAGEIVILAFIQAMLAGIHADRDVSHNTRALSACAGFGGATWLLFALPWFFLEKHRPGQKLPKGYNYLTVAYLQLRLACKHIWRLKQTLLYLIFYFLLSDTLNTAITVISTLQNDAAAFSASVLNELLIVGIVSETIGIFGLWYIQKRFGVSTLNAFRWVIFCIVVLMVWGFIGIFTQKFGYHNQWEFWVYQFWYGGLACPWYAVSFTMIGEVTPAGYEFLIFSLFGLIGKSSSFVGPFVSSAISNRTGNPSSPFYFLLFCTLASCLLLIPLDLKKSQLEQARFLEWAEREKEKASSGAAGFGLEGSSLGEKKSGEKKKKDAEGGNSDNVRVRVNPVEADALKGEDGGTAGAT